jgi:hypothetical protein
MLALVAVDTLFCSAALKVRVMECLNPEIKSRIGGALFLVASHTHNAPSLDPSKPVLGLVDRAYFEQAANAIASAINKAADGRGPCESILRGQASCMANARRRLKAIRIKKSAPFVEHQIFTLPSHAPDVPRDLVVFIGRGSSDTPRFVIWSWPCHATAFPHQNVVSADFPGEIRKYMRLLFNDPNLPIVFLPGLSGDIRADASPNPVPLWKRLMTPFARPFAEATTENFDLLCQLLAKACRDAADGAAVMPLDDWSIKHATKALRLNELMPDTSHPGEIALSLIACGPLNILMAGAEICSTWKPVLTPLLPLNTILTGYCNDVPCYLPTDAQVLEGGYEVNGFRGSFGVDGSFASDLERRVIASMPKLPI